MEITYLGQSSFKIKTKDTIVVTDPYNSEMIGMKFTKTEADIVTISHHHADHDAIENVTDVKKIVDGPGEYEIKGVSIIGVASFHDDKKGAERGKNTIYVLEAENLRLLHLGDLGHKLTDEEVKEIGNIDIMFIPVGGFYTIDSKVAAEVVKQIGASIIIPMHFKPEGNTNEVLGKLEPVENFITETSLRVEKLPKLTIKKDAINSEEEYAVILEKK
jgi:L-ascorbate metabolism protein UlaG (beta-lactamase superfamily)